MADNSVRELVLGLQGDEARVLFVAWRRLLGGNGRWREYVEDHPEVGVAYLPGWLDTTLDNASEVLGEGSGEVRAMRASLARVASARGQYGAWNVLDDRDYVAEAFNEYVDMLLYLAADTVRWERERRPACRT